MSFDIEPSYTDEFVVMFSFRDPDWLMHKPSDDCNIETPHHINECKIFNNPQTK